MQRARSTCFETSPRGMEREKCHGVTASSTKHLFGDQATLAIWKDVPHELGDGKHLRVVQRADVTSMLGLDGEEFGTFPFTPHHHERPDNSLKAHGGINCGVFVAHSVAHKLVPMTKVWQHHPRVFG